MSYFTTETIDSTERLAVTITRELYAHGDFGHEELERRLHSIIGLNGSDERRRVLHTDDVVDISCFGPPVGIHLTTSWRWPE